MDTRRDGSPLLESAVESYLEKRMKQIGGRAYKFMPSVKGNPDRLVVFPFGRIYFVELKRQGGKLSPAQALWHGRALEIGQVVHIIDSREKVDAFIEWAQHNGHRSAREVMDEYHAVQDRYEEFWHSNPEDEPA